MCPDQTADVTRQPDESRHPDNPLWCDHHDQPISINTRSDWEAAARDGLITVDHVLLRLQAMLEYEFGRGAEMGFDEDGFLVALVADSWRLSDGTVVRMHPNDHVPPHVHAQFKADPHRRLRFDLATGELLDERPNGWAKRLKKVAAFVVESHDLLMDNWQRMHGVAS